MNILKYIRLWIEGQYLELLLWLDNRDFKKKLRQRTPGARNQIIVNTTKQAYEQGILSIKKNINNMLDNRTAEKYDKTLSQVGDLLQFSQKSEETPEYIEAQKKAYIYSGTDVKSSLDKAHMIEKRIKDYEELKKHKELRTKLRASRKNKGDN